jgi:hypothetical protein
VDFIHTLLPTALPLPEFYGELADLYQHSLPLFSQLSLLRRIPLTEVPRLQAVGKRVRQRIREAYRDQA